MRFPCFSKHWSILIRVWLERRPPHLERWFADSSRYYVVPRQAQRSAIHEALDNYGQRLRSDWKKLLLFILKSLGEPPR